jgi:hypothetical protein
LTLPLIIDSQKHGVDNIIRRSGRDFLRYDTVRSVLDFFHVSAQRVSTAFVGTMSLAALFVVAYVGFKLMVLIREGLAHFFK